MVVVAAVSVMASGRWMVVLLDAFGNTEFLQSLILGLFLLVERAVPFFRTTGHGFCRTSHY
jgi:hypothetical protein